MTNAQTRRDALALEVPLAELARRHDVVGASVAIWRDGGLTTRSCGETRHGTGREMRSDTVLQIGSITKLYTATLVMQLVAAGSVGLDDAVRAHVPTFGGLARPDLEDITVRHLLMHTSGLESNFLADAGRGDDCLARYLDACSTIGVDGTPGLKYSYCNAGYAILGRLVEIVTGLTWDQVLQDRVLQPAALTATMTLPESVLLHDSAVGHFPVENSGWTTSPVWSVPRWAGPAGTICATASDVVRFLLCHTEHGPALLDPEITRAMQAPLVKVPTDDGFASCGLGWHQRESPHGILIGHTGGNMGQGGEAWLRPSDEVAACVLVNGVRSMDFFADLFAVVFG